MRGAFDLANDVNVINSLQTGNVVRRVFDARVDATDDHVAKVAHVQWLAHVLAAARNGKYRHALHEARQPAEVFPVEPSEHQRGPQHHAFDPRGKYDFFLLALGIGVEILGHRIHHRRTDMHGVRYVVLLDRREHMPRGRNVVADKRLERRRANLGLQHDNNISPCKMLLPVAGFGEVCVDCGDIGVSLAQDVQIRAELVEHDQVVIALRLQARYEVLAYKAGAARNHDAGLLHAIAQKKTRKGSNQASWYPARCWVP